MRAPLAKHCGRSRGSWAQCGIRPLWPRPRFLASAAFCRYMSTRSDMRLIRCPSRNVRHEGHPLLEILDGIEISHCSDLPAVGCPSKIQNNSGLPQEPDPSFDGRVMVRRFMRAICDPRRSHHETAGVEERRDWGADIMEVGLYSVLILVVTLWVYIPA